MYFYPRADTPGCTTQACGLRDILGARGIHFETTFVEDAPVVGAAVAGLIAQEA